MEIKLIPERLIAIRKQKSMNKAEMASLLNLSKMGYGRYESGERNPSYQTICFMADKLGTTVDYLTGLTDDTAPRIITIDRIEETSLYELANTYVNGGDVFRDRLITYYKELTKNNDNHEVQNLAESDEQSGIPHTSSEFEWEECMLSRYKGNKIHDLLEGENSGIIIAMCDVLKIVDDELKSDEIRITLKNKIKEHIEQECINLIPDWQK